MGGIERVLQEVWAERIRQDEKWGEQNHPIKPTGIIKVDNSWGTYEKAFSELANQSRMACNGFAAENRMTWFYILMEEFYEVFAEDVPCKQREELIHVAAVAVAMIECIDRNFPKE